MLKEILKILENDARTPPGQISVMTGLPLERVTSLIKKAEDERAIIKYKALINWSKVDVEQVWALIEVKVAPQPEVGFDSVAGRIALFPQVRSAYLASGGFDLLLVVVGKTERDIADFVAQKLAHIDGVKGTETHFVLKRYKEDGQILDGLEPAKRQPVVL